MNIIMTLIYYWDYSLFLCKSLLENSTLGRILDDSGF